MGGFCGIMRACLVVWRGFMIKFGTPHTLICAYHSYMRT
jgi:hypothetical protein